MIFELLPAYFASVSFCLQYDTALAHFFKIKNFNYLALYRKLYCCAKYDLTLYLFKGNIK
jgi:hypothetical protein